MKQIGLLLYLCPLILSAQETDIFKQMLKETLKPEFRMNFSLDFSDSVLSLKPIQLDATKKYMPHLGNNYKENQLILSSVKDYQSMKFDAISPYLTMPYTNRNKFDPNATETTGDVIANVVLTPVGSIIMINPVVLINFLIRAGAIPVEPFVPKLSRKERMLKTITKDVYHIDDDY